MGILSSTSIKTRLLLSFIVVLIFSMCVSALSLYSMVVSREIANQLDLQAKERYYLLNEAVHELTHVNSSITQYITPGKQDAEHKRYVDKSIEDFLAAVAKMPDTSADGTKSERVAAIKASSQEFIKLYQRDVEHLVNAQRPFEALEVYLNKLIPVYDKLLDQMQGVSAYVLDLIFEQMDHLNASTNISLVIVITLIQIGASFALAFKISNTMGRRLNNLGRFAEEIAHGDFTASVVKTRDDEIGRMADTIFEMRDTLKQTIQGFVDSAHQITTHMQNMQESAQQISDEMHATENQAVTVAASADEMVATTSNIAKNCTEAAASSQNSSNLTHESMDKLNANAQQIMQQFELLKQNAAAVESLAQQSQKIGSIVGTIDEIAAQTNLLALNAAIEAARAGEYGRGFAVVADEVRALATRTTSSTQEIRAMVDRIQSETHAATESMQNNLTAMNEVTEQTALVQQSLQTVLDHVNDVNGQITMIATAAEEQTSATSEISQNMQNITHSSSNVTSIAQKNTDIATDTANMLYELIKKLDYFKLK